tara:strand:- start:85 stop:402 length:318 start_codon:yes stop_codon:yes gene_type:complete
MNKPTFTKEPCILHCCRTDENGEGVDKSEYSDTDVTLAVVSNGEVQCMECGNNLLNARLIAAAPELFEALKAIYEIDVPDAEWSPTLEKCFGVALDAIAKVEGEK